MAFLGNILGGLLRFIYNLVSNIGAEPEIFSFYAMSIIITTIVFKLLILPLNIKQINSTKKMSELQPQMQEIQTKYKNDPQTQQAKLQELYKTHNFNPAAGCLPLLIQMPILFAFLALFREPTKYAFTDPGFYESMNKTLLWITNLDNPDPNLWGLPLLAALTTYFQSKVMAPPNADSQAASTQKTMSYFLPIMIFISARNFPAGLALYWVISNTFTIVQHLISNRSLGKIKEEE
ncbi:MAG TPA: YidC/Oxa1 family membrane protein insertase [Tissierellaceae bacterium]|nr:YidC/Oxa1 family membrane protein insertase [Tissierellaceae bacterium]